MAAAPEFGLSSAARKALVRSYRSSIRSSAGLGHDYKFDPFTLLRHVPRAGGGERCPRLAALEQQRRPRRIALEQPHRAVAVPAGERVGLVLGLAVGLDQLEHGLRAVGARRPHGRPARTDRVGLAPA